MAHTVRTRGERRFRLPSEAEEDNGEEDKGGTLLKASDPGLELFPLMKQKIYGIMGEELLRGLKVMNSKTDLPL